MTYGTELAAWGWALLMGSVVAVGTWLYRFIWLERYRPPPESSDDGLRLRGHVIGPTQTAVYCLGPDGEELVSQPFTMLCDDRRVRTVLPSGAVLSTRRYRRPGGVIRGIVVGDRVTVDGIRTTVVRRESLYREAGRTRAVQAVRIVAGTWPAMRWLRLPMVLAALLCLVSLAQILTAPLPTKQMEQGVVGWLAPDSKARSTFYFGGSGPDEEGLGVLLGLRTGERRLLPRDRLTLGSGLRPDRLHPPGSWRR